jgi:hypothetical protein
MALNVLSDLVLSPPYSGTIHQENSAQLSLCSAWLSLAGGVTPFFFYFSFSWVNTRLHTENQPCAMPGSA